MPYEVVTQCHARYLVDFYMGTGVTIVINGNALWVWYLSEKKSKIKIKNNNNNNIKSAASSKIFLAHLIKNFSPLIGCLS